MAANPPTPQSNAAGDGLDYFRDVIENDLPDLGAQFEAMSASALETSTLVAVTEIGAEVTATMEGIEPLSFAAALLLAMYVSGWIVQKVAAVFPNPSLFGWHPLGFIKDGLNSMGAEWEHAALDIADYVKHFLMQPIRMILSIFQRVANAISSAHNKIAHLANVIIPTVAADAVQRAENYTVNQVHNLDTQVSGAVDRLTSLPGEGAARTLISDAVKYGGLGWMVTAIGAGAVVAADEFAKSVGATAQQHLTTATQKVAQNAQTAINTLHDQLVRQLTGDENALSALATTVNTTVPAEIMSQVQKAQATDAQNLSRTAQGLQGQINALQTQLNTLTSRIANDEQVVATATAHISALENAQTVDAAAITTQRQLIATAQSDIISNITSIKDINTQITGISNTLAPVQAAQQLNTAQLSPFEGMGDIALPTLLATLSSTLTNLKTKVDTCSVETCDPSSPLHIKNQLMSLLGLLTAAGEIGFIAEAVRDPLGVAASLAPILDSIDSGAEDTLNTILGLL